jgi:replicative DNA helicase
VSKLRKDIKAFRANPTNVWGLPTGLEPLDRFLGGLQPGDLIIVGGRPSMGKTSFGMQASFDIAERFKKEAEGQIVYIGSAEMRAPRLLMREVGRRTGINPEYIKRGQIDDGQMQQIEDCLSWLESLPVFIDDEYGLPTDELRKRIVAMEAAHGIKVGHVTYDYLQLAAERVFDDFKRVSAAAKNLKRIAHDMGIPVIGLSQLNRKLEDREDKLPTLADLKNSGDIEDVTDVVLLLHRPDYHKLKLEGREGELGEAQIIIAKNRDGQTGLVRCEFDPVCTAFRPLDG